MYLEKVNVRITLVKIRALCGQRQSSNVAGEINVRFYHNRFVACGWETLLQNHSQRTTEASALRLDLVNTDDPANIIGSLLTIDSNGIPIFKGN